MTNSPKPFFFFVGKPASGKETQARLLMEKLDYPILISGAKFRELMQSGSFLGDRVKECYETGHLLPAWIADYLLQDFVLHLGPEKGAVFEGFGRDLEQVDTIEKVTRWLKRPYYVIHLKVSDDTVVERSVSRGRDVVDSDEDAIRNRLSEYAKLTDPAIEKFASLGKQFEVDGEESPEKIHEEILEYVRSVTT